MKNRSLRFIVLSLAAMLLAACAKPADKSEDVEQTGEVTQKIEAETPAQPQEAEEEDESAETSNKTFTDTKYGFSFEYPENWTVSEPSADPEAYNLTVWDNSTTDVTSSFKSNIQINEVYYATDPMLREDYIKEYQGDSYEKMAIPGADAYYFVGENPGGKFPAAAIVTAENIFLISFNYAESDDFTLEDAEKWFKEWLLKMKFS